ncbi:MAG: hypothetical protein R2792_04440 [Saprospiraceae bacterium]
MSTTAFIAKQPAQRRYIINDHFAIVITAVRSSTKNVVAMPGRFRQHMHAAASKSCSTLNFSIAKNIIQGIFHNFSTIRIVNTGSVKPHGINRLPPIFGSN